MSGKTLTPSLTFLSPTTTETGISGLGLGTEMEDGRGQQRAKQGDGAERQGLLHARASMPGSRLDPEWSQDGPFTDPRDTIEVAVSGGHRLPRGLILPLRHPLKAPSSQGRSRWAASHASFCAAVVAAAAAAAGPRSPVRLPLVPLSVLVLLGSWVLQVRDIGKVILLREP